MRIHRVGTSSKLNKIVTNRQAIAKPSLVDDGPLLSSVYSLAVHREGLWLLSGLESGGINLQSVRHDEGKIISCLREHTSAVSVLNLAQDEKSVLSGSWDKLVIDWDLNTGKPRRTFEGSGGQISALEVRPLSSLPVPEASGEATYSSTFSTDYSDKPRADNHITNGAGTNSLPEPKIMDQNTVEEVGSPTDSLFGGNDADSLFGDNGEGEAGAGAASGFIDDEEDDFSRVIANGIRNQETADADGDVDMGHAGEEKLEPISDGTSANKSTPETGAWGDSTGFRDATSSSLTNGLPRAEGPSRNDAGVGSLGSIPPDGTSVSDSVFLAASFDGSLHVWDKRQPSAIARITPRNVPPWCMNACWSPDGNFIYAGRRNGTVEEYSLRKGLNRVERILRLPSGSGPVSAVRAMPNGRHLVWLVPPISALTLISLFAARRMIFYDYTISSNGKPSNTLLFHFSSFPAIGPE